MQYWTYNLPKSLTAMCDQTRVKGTPPSIWHDCILGVIDINLTIIPFMPRCYKGYIFCQIQDNIPNCIVVIAICTDTNCTS